MKKYQAKSKQERKQAPETPQRTHGKIIPFPGVTIKQEVTYMNALDDYLREQRVFLRRLNVDIT